MKNQNILKSCLKGRVRFTLGLFVAFMITGSIVFGVESVDKIEGKNGVVIDLTGNGPNYPSISIGKGNKASSMNTISIGTDAEASGIEAISIGDGTKAKGKNSVAIGNGAQSIEESNIAIGLNAKSTGKKAVVIGEGAQGAGHYSLTIGMGAKGNSLEDVVIGKNAESGPTLNSHNSVVIGSNAYIGELKTSNGETGVRDNTQVGSSVDPSVIYDRDKYAYSVAVGHGAQSFGNGNISLGTSAQSFNNNTTALGSISTAKENYASAIGYESSAIGERATALGAMSYVKAEKGLALGADTLVNVQNGVALGSDSKALRGANKFGYDFNKNQEIKSLNQIEGLNVEDYNKLQSEISQLDQEIEVKKSEILEIEKSMKSTRTSVGAEQREEKINSMQEMIKNRNAKISEMNKMVSSKMSTLGEVAIGDDALGHTRQITGVAAGTEDTDAVNVSQLKELNKQILDKETHWVNVNRQTPPSYALEGTNYDKEHSGALGDNSVAIGPWALAEGTNTVAIGKESKALDYNNIAIGKAASAEKSGGIALGEGSNVLNVHGLSMLAYSNVYDSFGIAIGREAQVGKPTAPLYPGDSQPIDEDKHLGGAANSGIAIGKYTKVYGDGAVALGRDSYASGNASVAIGKGSVATENNTISFGIAPDIEVNSEIAGNRPSVKGFTRRLVNVANGIKETDVATVNQLRQIRTFDVTIGDKKVNVLQQDGELYNISDLTFEGGKYYKTSEVAGKMYSSDGKFYDIAALKNHTYILPGKDSVNSTGGYYSNDVVIMDTSSGNYSVSAPGAKPVQDFEIPTVNLEEYKLQPQDKLKLKVENITNEGKPVMAMTNIAAGEISENSTDAINGSQLKGFADKIGLEVDTDNTVKAPELKDIRNEKPASIVDATNKLATEVNKGFTVAAVAGEPVVKYFGDTVTIKNGNLTDTQYLGKNLSTEIKDGNILIGMEDKPEFGGVVIKRNPETKVVDDNEVLTKAETSALAKSSIKVINGTNTTVSEGTEGDIKTYAVNISDEAIKNAVKGDLDSKADVTTLNELKDQINTSKDTDDKRNEYLGESDNLNNVAINDKVNAIRRGEAGSIVYTDRENARIKRAKDSKLYKEEYINPETDLPWEDTDVKALETTSVIASVVNVDGSTTNKTILSNIADGVKDNDAVNIAQLNQVKENLNTATENLGNIDKKIDGVQTKVNDNSSKLDNLDKALNEAKGLLAGLGDRLEDDNDSRNLNNDKLNGDTINNKINAIRRGEAGSLVYTDGNGERVVKADNGNFYRLKDVDGTTNNPLEDKVSNIVKSEDVVQTLVNTKGETTEPIKLKNVKAGNVGANSTDAVNGDQLYKYSKWKIQTEDNESTRGTVGYDPDSEGNEVLTLKTKNSIDQDKTSKNLTISNIGNTVEFSLNKDIKVETVNANKIVINRNNEVTEDSDVLNKKETTELIKNTVKTDMDSKMNKNLSNIDNAGEQKIKEIAKKTITADLENYAKKDASNIVKENWTKALGTGEITETSEELVTGKTVKAALDTKAEKSDLANLASKNLDNLSDKGREVINKQAKEALKSDFETANKNIKSNADAINKNKESIKAVDKVSSENTKAIKQNTSDIKDNNKNIAKNKDEIANVKDKADNNEKNIDANKKAIANHEERITKNEKVLKETYQAQAEVLANHAQAINENRNAIRSLNNRVDHLDDKLNKGMALMSAMTTVDFQDVNPGEMGIGAGIGSYGNSQGVAVGVAYSPSENFRINAKYSVSTSDIKTSAVGVGAVYKFKVR